MEEFKYLRVLFTNKGKRDCEIGCRLGKAAAVMQFSVYRSVYIPTLTCGRELFVMTDSMRVRIQQT